MHENVGQIMTLDPVVVDAGTSVSDCARLMDNRDIGSLGVTQDGTLSGVLTDRDIVIRVVARRRNPDETTAGDIATPRVVTVKPDTSVVDAVKLMGKHAVRRLFVLDEQGALKGILTADDMTAIRDPDSVVAQQLGEWAVWRGDQGYSGDSD